MYNLDIFFSIFQKKNTYHFSLIFKYFLDTYIIGDEEFPFPKQKTILDKSKNIIKHRQHLEEHVFVVGLKILMMNCLTIQNEQDPILHSIGTF